MDKAVKITSGVFLAIGKLNHKQIQTFLQKKVRNDQKKRDLFANLASFELILIENRHKMIAEI